MHDANEQMLYEEYYNLRSALSKVVDEIEAGDLYDVTDIFNKLEKVLEEN